ncbi:hypothetical protein TWF718_010848 [Orbilia javanica]|uniref:Uncharacterized protein n=1 Tax=Orbilia javanica TaxID=47235 RepID=A0AAN8MKN2_9PEZI
MEFFLLLYLLGLLCHGCVCLSPRYVRPHEAYNEQTQIELQAKEDVFLNQNIRDDAFSTTREPYAKIIPRTRRLKRAGDDDPDIAMIDKEEVDLSILQSLDAEEKQKIKEVYSRGGSLLLKEEEVFQDPINKDPTFDWSKLEKAVAIRNNAHGFPPAGAEVLREMGRDDVIQDPESYVVVSRSIPMDDGTQNYGYTLLKTYISEEASHMYFQWPGKLPSGAQHRDWIYQCWLRGLDLTGDNSNGRAHGSLRYITIQGIDSGDTLAILKALIREWEGRDLETSVEGGLVLARDDMDPKLARSNSGTISYFKFLLFRILLGVPEISPIVEMLSKFPNTFAQYQVSTITFKLGGAHGADGPANIFLQLDLPISYRYAGAGSTHDLVAPSFIGSSLAAGKLSNLIKHPSSPDIERTSYGWAAAPGSTPGQTFFRQALQHYGTAYRFSVSGREKHIVFEGYLVGALSVQVLQDYSEKNLDQEMHFAVHDAWIRTAGQTALYEITFASVHPQSRSKIKEIREKQKPADITPQRWDEKIAVFEELQTDFNDILQTLSETREGKVLSLLREQYGRELGFSGVSRIEIGVYTSAAARKRKGKFFVLVGLKPLLKTDPLGIPVLEAGMTRDEANPSVHSIKKDFPIWIPSVTTGSATVIYSQAVSQAVYVNTVLEMGQFLVDLGIPVDAEAVYREHELFLLVSSYTIKANKVNAEDATREALDFLGNLPRDRMRFYGAFQPNTYQFFITVVGKRFQVWAPTSKLPGYHVTVSSGRSDLGNLNQESRPQYGLFVSLENGVVAILSWPEVTGSDEMEFENAVFAAWHHVYAYASHGYTYDTSGIKHLGVCDRGPQFFMLLEVRQPTRLIIEEIYRQESLPKSESLLLTGTPMIRRCGSMHTAHFPMQSLPRGNTPESLRHFLALVGSPDLIGISGIGAKYSGTLHNPCKTTVRDIIIRWVSQSEGGELHPQVFISLRAFDIRMARSFSDRARDIELGAHQKLALQELSAPVSLGQTISSLLSLNIPVALSEATDMGEDQWDVVQLEEAVRSPRRAFHLIEAASFVLFHDGNYQARYEEVWDLAKESYRRLRVRSRTEDLSGTFLVHQMAEAGASTGVYGHLIVESLPPLADASSQGIERLSQIYFNSWDVGSKGASAGRGTAVPLPRVVTFLGFSPETQSIINFLWQGLQTQEEASSEIKLRVTTDPYFEEQDEKFVRVFESQGPRILNAHAVAWDALAGTTEILALSHWLRVNQARNPTEDPAVKELSIRTIYVETSADGSGIQGTVYIGEAASRPEEQDVEGDDEEG